MKSNPTVAARVFTVLIAGTMLFQLLLAAGLPWGNVAWGGAYPGVLPAHMRAASAVSIFLLLAFAYVILVRAGILHARWNPAFRVLAWVVVAYCALGVIANAITPSFWERVIWLPVTLLLLWTSLVVARTR